MNRRNVSWYESRLHPEEMDYESDMENDMFDETEHTSAFDAEIESLHYETKLPAELEFPGSETVDSDSETMVPRSQTVQRELAGFKRPRKPQQPLTFAELIDFSCYGEYKKSDLLSTTKEMESKMPEQTSVFDAEKESLHYETKLPAELEIPGSETVDSDSETMVPRSQMVQRELAGFKCPRKPQQPLTFAEMTNSTNMSWYDSWVNNVEVDYDLVIDFSSDGEDEKSDLLSTTKEMESEMPEHTSVFDAEKESLPNETHLSAELEISGSETVVPSPQTVRQELVDFKSRQIDDLLKQVDHLKEKLQNTNTCFNQEKEKRLAAENQSEKLEQRHLDLEAMFSREKDEKVNAEKKFLDKLENLKKQLSEKDFFIKDLTQSNSELRVVVENLTAENAASHKELVEQQESFKHQLQDKSCDLLKQVDHLKEKLQNTNTCFNQEKEKRLAAENQCALYKEQTKEMENGLVQQQQKLVALEKQLQEQKNVNEDLQKICSDLRGETDESRFSGVSRDVLIENFEKLVERHLDLEVMLSREKDEKISVEQKLTDKLENLKEQLSEKNVFIESLQTDLDQERQFRLVSVQEQKNAQHKVTVNENYKKEMKDLKKRNGDLSELLNNIKTDLKNRDMKLLEERNNFKHQLKQKKLICEDLEKRLNKENELRLTCEEELKKTKDQMSSMNGNLKKEINDLKQKNLELSQTLRSGQAVVTKSEQMCEDLQKFKQLLHEKMSVCEELSSSLDMEKQLRVSYEAQLDSNRTIVCENSDLKEQIEDLTQSNSELRVVVENLTAENAASHKELVEQQESFKHQLQDKSCDLLKQVDHLKEKLQITNTCFNQEKEKRLAAENQCALYKEQTKEMENGLVQQQQKLVALEKQLQEQKNVNEDLQKICSDLRGETDGSRFSGVSRDVLIENFEKLEERHLDLEVMLSREKDEKISVEQKLTDKLENLKEQLSEKNVFIKDLTQSNSELRVVVENLTAENAASHKELVEQLESFKHQLQDKSVVCENLEAGFTNEQKLRLQLSQQLQETSGLCESLENQLRDEQKIRLGLETELAQNRDVVSAGHDDLMAKLEQMEEKETKLSKIIVNLQLRLFRRKTQHEEELGILKEQVSKLVSRTTNLESQNLILRLKTERFNPDQQTEAISEQIVLLAESLMSQRDAPHSGTKKLDKVSVWRHFKKSVTPGRLRQHKNRQPSN
ncbi:putative leucine-rich repeat-containing protein DDB_G0290503 [Nothobranchius furzeri]|uniref:putative leucine-rich repeat-containing protein DDB_G0290503 n=1 Tax=Nothobranchius furzeri TaxID=105023 RepID=UPI00390472E7